MEAPKSMTCYFDLGMRNKVLPVLLAAGMLATMPATTAVNVLADVTDTQTAEDVVGDTVKEKTTTLSWSDWDAVNETVLLNVTQTSQLKNCAEP